MFSRRNFSWKRWLFLSATFFVASWLVSLVLHSFVEPEIKDETFSGSPLVRRLILSVVIGFVLSFSKKGTEEE